MAPREPIKETARENLERLGEILGHPIDLVTQLHGPGDCAGIAFITGLTDQKDLKSNLLAPLLPLVQAGTTADGIAAALPEIAPGRLEYLEEAVADLLEGRALLFLNGARVALSFATQGWTKRRPKEPQSERTIRGPREGFTETLDENIGMIRRWFKDERLRADPVTIGRRTKTRIAVMYLSDVAQGRMVREVFHRLSAIDVDGIIESGYLEQYITDRRASIFPLTQATERTDKVAAAILEGRVAILVDKSPYAIIVPVTINELYQSPEDYYFSFWLGSFLRLIRLIGNNLAVALPGLYVAMVAVNPELLPTQFALAIASSRIHIPIPLVAEVVLLEVAVEFFREAGLRLPGMVGETLGVVSGVIIGMASMAAGIISPVTLVVVSITAIASFTGPNYAVSIAWRLLKYIMLAAAGLFGIYGLIVSGMFILTLAADVKSFGVSYLAPWSPLLWPELANGPVRAPLWVRWYRPRTYRPKDQLRIGGTRGEDEEDERE